MTWTDEFRFIPLGHNKYAIVDAEDYGYISQFRWYLGSGGYANRHPHMIHGIRHRKITIHGSLLHPPRGFVVDHINGNKLDNRRKNLRIVTHTQNTWNAKVLGVSYHTRDKVWQARTQNNGKRKQLGYFGTKEAAIEARKAFIKQTRGIYARL